MNKASLEKIRYLLQNEHALHIREATALRRIEAQGSTHELTIDESHLINQCHQKVLNANEPF